MVFLWISPSVNRLSFLVFSMNPETSGIGIRTIAVELEPSQLKRAQAMFSDTDRSVAFFFDGRVEYATSGVETVQGRLHRMLPKLHFMSFLIFKESHYDPLLIMELNYDGEPGQLWPVLEDCIGTELRELLRCTKRPMDRLGSLYDEAVLCDQPVPLAPYLEAIASKPATPYRGARGLSREQIVQEYELYNDAQAVLDNPESTVPGNAEDIHQFLKTSLAEKYENYFQQNRFAKTPWRVRIKDYLVFVFAIITAYSFIVFLLASPVVFLYLAEDAFQISLSYATILLLVLALSFVVLYLAKQPAIDVCKIIGIEKYGNDFVYSLAALLIVTLFSLSLLGIQSIVFIVIVTPVLAVFDSLFNQSQIFARAMQFDASLGLLGQFEHVMFYLYSRYSLFSYAAFVFGVSLFWAWLRYREVVDSSHDGAQVDEEILCAMAARENHVIQNHMGSLLTVRPGILRYLLVQISHSILNSLARVVFSNGILGSMRTIHFAHWVFVGKGNRLLFLSNFDGSWESYLDDFTEKASVGVNIAWSQCIGFPKSNFIVGGGSERGGLFKNWARHSMTQTLFWYSAYPDLSVQMIHRNHVLAKGLCQDKLPDYSEWARGL